ncbi:olfactory receptor 1019-like [Tachyglossus aculeatus]|uniref:olfactory receptor 1019-like n=1 Tax=Tachyglossus aculeatus TaxID=9261 RepID=UPI0018F76B71|nr:olfactory receptor 1019-like [Tachyglossus aculeatus]
MKYLHRSNFLATGVPEYEVASSFHERDRCMCLLILLLSNFQKSDRLKSLKDLWMCYPAVLHHRFHQLLVVMAYDRYITICNVLLYPAMVSRKTWFQLLAGSFLRESLCSLIHTSFTFRLSFCHFHIICHYFCDIPPLLALSCSDTCVNKILIFAVGSLEVAVSLSTIFSYLFILVTILRIHSAEGRHKAFSTCTSHLTANVLLYGTLIFTYLCPSSSSALDQSRWCICST